MLFSSTSVRKSRQTSFILWVPPTNVHGNQDGLKPRAWKSIQCPSRVAAPKYLNHNVLPSSVHISRKLALGVEVKPNEATAIQDAGWLTAVPTGDITATAQCLPLNYFIRPSPGSWLRESQPRRLLKDEWLLPPRWDFSLWFSIMYYYLQYFQNHFWDNKVKKPKSPGWAGFYGEINRMSGGDCQCFIFLKISHFDEGLKGSGNTYRFQMVTLYQNRDMKKNTVKCNVKCKWEN